MIFPRKFAAWVDPGEARTYTYGELCRFPVTEVGNLEICDDPMCASVYVYVWVFMHVCCACGCMGGETETKTLPLFRIKFEFLNFMLFSPNN